MRTVVSCLLAVAVLLAAVPSSAQDWSDAQKEVWKNVEKYWEISAKEDLDGFMSYVHDDFLGWATGQWVPTNKADRRVGIERTFATTESVFYYLKPVGIRIFGDVAIVHYFYTDTSKDAKGEEKTVWGHWTDILMKQGDRWVMIGDAGGQVPEDDD